MPVIVKFNGGVTTQQSSVIPDATVNNAGVLTPLQVQELADIVAGTVASVTGAAPITSTGGLNPNSGIPPATDVAAGSMSAADKTKLDGLSPGGGTTIAQTYNNGASPT